MKAYDKKDFPLDKIRRFLETRPCRIVKHDNIVPHRGGRLGIDGEVGALTEEFSGR